MSFFSSGLAEIYVDLGTANTLIAKRGKGVVVNEPTLIAYSETSPGHRRIIAVGREAVEKVQSSPGHIFADRPLRDGVIANADTTEIMLQHFLQKHRLMSFFSKPIMVISLPYGVTEVEKRAAIEAGKSAGAKDVILIDEPMAAAIGAGMQVKSAQGAIIVDIGGGTTEVAVIALADIVACTAIRMGGYRMDEAIQRYFRNIKNLIISEATAERLKKDLGTATPRTDIITKVVEGRNADTGLSLRMEVTSEDVGLAMDGPISEIIEAIHATIEKTPPELVSDVIETGIALTGGGALIKNLALRIQNEVHLPVRVAPSPLTAIAQGGEALLNDPELLDKVQLSV